MPSTEHRFMHWRGSPDIAPFIDHLLELGLLKFSGVRPHSLDMHYNDGIEICYIIKGSHTWEVEEKQYSLYPGEGFVTCPWQRHGNPDGYHERGMLCWVIIHPERYDKDGVLKLGSWSRLGEDTQQEIGRLFAKNHDHLIPNGTNLFPYYKKLNEELTEKKIGYKERINLLLDSLLVEVARAIQERKDDVVRNEDFAQSLRREMETFIHEKISVGKIASTFGMSSSSFNRKVKSLTGYTPAEYLQQLRIGKSKELLTDSDRPIAGIALECGFASPQHFATRFTEITGKTPRAYRISKMKG